MARRSRACTYAVDNIRRLMGRQPIFGICLGHQLTGIALGGKTFKLKFGHHGGNHPVKQLNTGKIEITATTIISPSIPFAAAKRSRTNHMDLNDNTLEGMRHRNLPLFTVQYIPSNRQARMIALSVRDFVKLMEEWKG